MRLLGDITKVYGELSALLPKEAIQKTDKNETKKGYSTSGYGYQYVVNKFNETCNVDGWSYDYKILETSHGTFQSGKSYVDITVEVTINIHLTDIDKVVTISRKCIGNHLSSVYGDALKGALTNGIKKTSALFGVGNQAYLGILDDDAIYEEELGGKKEKPKELPPPTTESVPATKKKKIGEGAVRLFGVIKKITGENKEKIGNVLEYVSGFESFYDVPDDAVPGIIIMLEKTLTDCPRGTHPCDNSEWDDLGNVLCKKTGRKCFFPEGERGMEEK
jgi:hypothetical protein